MFGLGSNAGAFSPYIISVKECKGDRDVQVQKDWTDDRVVDADCVGFGLQLRRAGQGVCPSSAPGWVFGCDEHPAGEDKRGPVDECHLFLAAIGGDAVLYGGSWREGNVEVATSGLTAMADEECSRLIAETFQKLCGQIVQWAPGGGLWFPTRDSRAGGFGTSYVGRGCLHGIDRGADATD